MKIGSRRLNSIWSAVCLVVLGGCTNGGRDQDPGGGFASSTTSSLSALSVTINSVSTGKVYTTATAATGITYYTDRTYTVGSLSAGLVGGVLIKTANDDKNVTRANYLRFTPSSAATVYVAMDKRTTRLPGWLDSTWRLTGESFVSIGDSAASPKKVYAKAFGTVQVQLGGNRQSPAAGMATNYVVVVVASAPQGGSGGSGSGGGAGTGGAGTGGAGTGGAGTGGAGTGGAGTGGAGTGGAGGTNACVAHAPVETIGSNHDPGEEHILVVTAADAQTGVQKAYDIRGNADHSHTVTITATMFTMLRAGTTITTPSSTAGSHSHGITVICA